VTVDELNARHGTEFVLAGDYEDGEVGAQRLLDTAGARFVLKLQPPGLAPQTTVALRAVGYPAPRYVIATASYSVQAELPGSPLGGWGTGDRDDILELNALQAGRAVDDDRSWPARGVESVLTGFEEYMVVATLAAHSRDGQELLDRCRRAVERQPSSLKTNADIVHWDFTASNILVDGARITGVIDWGGTCSGDCLFDLATYLFYARGSAPRLERYLLDRLGPQGLSVYLAHMAVRQADWSIRHHGGRAGWEMVRYGLALARAFPSTP
jgi:Phosphotransferase enzyme family